ncbi:hypothetical protein CY35_06G143200 [Sphagnum magellanicum]|nr:hypothetical protein CY35_06G143200 [Sphagnum magellanicum]
MTTVQSQIDSQLPHIPAFIAGNPKPMGLKCRQLPYAAEEAEMVASYFHVKPCLGKEMTKKAILEGLANSGVVLLATHGKVDEEYPCGCLLLQGPTKSCDVTCTSASISAQTYVLMVEEPPSMPAGTPKGKGTIQHEPEHATDKGGHDRLSLFEGTDVETKRMKAEEADQVLTAAEIATLENGISAELVVLSAYEADLGQATASEGLLGLGRALLQAGAATAILTLWKVDGLMTSRFVVCSTSSSLQPQKAGM